MMRNRNFRILEYDKIIDLLAAYASSDMVKKRCLKLKPVSDLMEIEKRQDETYAAYTRLLRHGNLSFAGLKDIRPMLHMAEIGGSLSSAELLDIARLLEIVGTATSYNEENAQADALADNDCIDHYFEELEPVPDLLREIRRCILSENEFANDASPSLKSIRKNMQAANTRIRTELNKIISSQSNQIMMQDNLVTMRNNRYCIPVKAEYKNAFPGMIHDQSATGSTLFIEPMSVVSLNNELTELAIKEQNEIERILLELTERVKFEQEYIDADLTILVELDFIFAKARFARSYDGTRPRFNEQGIINIKKGRHPLLDPKKVVPIDIALGDAYTMLIITGPNTGGKTVSLKTLGLFTLMGEAGLLIPAAEDSELAVFDRVYADIGDEQSIEMSLSTFSAHMTSIVRILQNVTAHSLVLFDELGGGTDPTEGAALAIAILSYLHGMGVRVAATTHYSELKVFALSTDGIENGCCEFDLASLAPTYRLLIGVPGKSNAFAISKKLGLPDYIIESAKTQIDDTSMDMERLLSDLEESRITIEKEQQEITAYKKEIAELRKKTEAKQEDLNKKKEQILKSAREEARDLLEKAKKEADESIRLYQKWVNNPEKANNKAMEQQRTHLRKNLNKLDHQLIEKPKKKAKKKQNITFSKGDYVYIESMGLEGEIVSQPDKKGDCYVQAGILKTLVHTSDLEPMEAPKEEKQTATRKPAQLNFRSAVPPEINLLGKTVDEALSQLDKYLDDAYRSNYHTVTIIHGKGTGALRAGVQNYLKRQSIVKSFRAGVYGEGEAGVTVVEFK